MTSVRKAGTAAAGRGARGVLVTTVREAGISAARGACSVLVMLSAASQHPAVTRPRDSVTARRTSSDTAVTRAATDTTGLYSRRLTPLIPRTVCRYFGAYPFFYYFVFLFFSTFSCWFRAAD